MKKYEDLTLIPSIIADTVVSRPYDGSELERPDRQPDTIRAIEAKRRNLNPDQIVNFIKMCDRQCRHAYENRAIWFIRCIAAEDNRGRDQLYLYTMRWLRSFVRHLDRFDRFKETRKMSNERPHQIKWRNAKGETKQDILLVVSADGYYVTYDDDAKKLEKAIGIKVGVKPSGESVAGFPVKGGEQELAKILRAGLSVRVIE